MYQMHSDSLKKYHKEKNYAIRKTRIKTWQYQATKHNNYQKINTKFLKNKTYTAKICHNNTSTHQFADRFFKEIMRTINSLLINHSRCTKLI